jgi:hypothetical protein
VYTKSAKLEWALKQLDEAHKLVVKGLELYPGQAINTKHALSSP